MSAFGRAALRRLARAIAERDARGVLDAGQLVAATIRRERDPTSAARRTVASLEALALALDERVPAAVARHLERAADDAWQQASAAAGGERLGALFASACRDVSALCEASAEGRTRSPERALHEYLAGRMGSEARLGDLARAAGYSTSHMSQVVRRVTGRPFVALRRDMLLERATFHLRRGRSVKEAALAAGFRDPAYFSRVFRRAFGVPPSRWAPDGASSAPAHATVRPPAPRRAVAPRSSATSDDDYG